MVEQRHISRFEVYGALVGVSVVLALVVYVMVILWPWHVLIALSLLFIGLSAGGMRLFMAWEHHRVDIEAKRNRAHLIYESEQGFGYMHQGRIEGYSHVSQVPPQVGMGQPMPEMLLPMPVEEKAEFPKTFREMLHQGFVAPGAPMSLAFNEEEGDPIKLPGVSTLGIGGFPGMGKTVTTSLLMMLSIAKHNGQIRFLVFDPHMYSDTDESLVESVEVLSPFFLTWEDVRATVPEDDAEYLNALEGVRGLQNPSSGEDADIERWMKIVQLEMKRRLRGKKGDVWVIVMDEFAEVMSGASAKAVATVLEKINQQARKVEMFAFLISQEWKVSRTGGSELRNSIASFVLHSMPESVAGLIVPSDVASKAMRLDVGEIILYNRGRDQQGRVPFVDEGDMETLVGLYQPWRLHQLHMHPVSIPALLGGGGDEQGGVECPSE